jgi:phenylalanyl-tRNA synthetase beta chain
MKVSVNLVKKYLDFDPLPISDLENRIGSQLGAVESVTDLNVSYQGIMVAKVVKCEPHPNADRLHVCKIDAGGKAQNLAHDDGYIQVVCGAPNVREGLMVAWIPPGAVVPESLGKDAFTIETREIRGQTSNGMLASPRELALGASHEGILEITDNAQPGQPFAEVYALNDYIIDLENKMFTHRPDCFGILGVAREIAGIYGRTFHSPGWYQPDPELPVLETEALNLEVKNELPELVPRFCVIALDNIEVKESPFILQTRLSRLGVRPINNVVDLTNYYMLLIGQPLHAYDYDKVQRVSGDDGQVSLVIRHPRAGEKLMLLGGKEVEPKGKAIMIATTQKAIGIGGIMGGAETEVDENTKRIIVECANFDMYSIRRTSMACGLFTDAATRFTKGQSPLQNLAVLAKITADLKQLTGGKVATKLIDDNHLLAAVLERKSVYPPVNVSTEFINTRLGLKLSTEEITKLLENVEIAVQRSGDEGLIVKAPFWRTDIEIPEDVVEEVGRLHGYDKLPLELPKRDITPAPKDQLLSGKAAIRAHLAKSGANEVLTYSFVHGNLLDKVGQDRAKAFQIANALSPDLQYYRLSLMPSLLSIVHPNIKAGYDKVALFELGKIHGVDQGSDEDDLPREVDVTALVVAAADKLKKSSGAYYEARCYLENLVGSSELEFKPVTKEAENYSVVQPYELNRTALVNIKGGEFLGVIGEFKPSVSRALKLPKYCAGFEIDTKLVAPILAAGPKYSPLPRFPKVTQDITLRVAADLEYQTLFDFVRQKINEFKPAHSLVELTPVDIYQKEDDKSHKQVTFRLNIANYARTLTDNEVSKLLDVVAMNTKETLKAERV